MLPHQYRLPANIRLKNPVFYTTPFFTVKIASNELTYNRYGFVIGKAASKLATERNRARRVLRSCIEERLVLIENGHDMLFLLKKGIIEADREKLSSEIEKLLVLKKLFKDSQIK